MNRMALEQAVKGKEVFSSYLQVYIMYDNFTHELSGCPIKGIDQWEKKRVVSGIMR